MDDVIIHDKRDGFSPSVRGFKVFQQTDEQCRTFAAATYVANLARTAVQCACQIVF